MPLIKSGNKNAVGRNIATELDAGKPRAQAIAIAEAIKRRAMKAARKCACGGKCGSCGKR
jgi:hypothetical protein